MTRMFICPKSRIQLGTKWCLEPYPDFSILPYEFLLSIIKIHIMQSSKTQLPDKKRPIMQLETYYATRGIFQAINSEDIIPLRLGASFEMDNMRQCINLGLVSTRPYGQLEIISNSIFHCYLFCSILMKYRLDLWVAIKILSANRIGQELEIFQALAKHPRLLI